jgi:galactokinase/mevalonate kinase-like predicted kinase
MRKGYAKWLGERHRQRVWGELMSDETALIAKRRRRQTATDTTNEDNSAIDSVALESDDAVHTSEEAQFEQSIGRGWQQKQRAGACKAVGRCG